MKNRRTLQKEKGQRPQKGGLFFLLIFSLALSLNLALLQHFGDQAPWSQVRGLLRIEFTATMNNHTRV